MADPDIRIRLSAEGVAEVVAAFRKVQAESHKTGKETAAGVGLGNKALLEMKGLLKGLFPFLGITGAVVGLATLAKNAFRSADAMEKLSQKTGLTVETLSILSSAAKKVDVDPERLEKGLIKFAKARDELVGGNKDMEEAFRRLGISRKEALELGQDEMVLRLVDRLGKLGDSYQKTAIAQQILGRGGAELIPVFNRLAVDGVEETRRRLEEMGLLMSKDFAEAAEAAAQGMKKLQSQARGAATQFVAGFVPGITQAIDAMNEAVTGRGVNGFKTLGESAAWVLKAIVALVVTVGKAVGATIAIWEVRLSTLIAMAKGGIQGATQGWETGGVKSAISGFWKGAEGAYREGTDKIGVINEEFKKDIEKVYTDLFLKPPKKPAKIDMGDSPPDRKDKEGVNKLLAAQQAAANAREAFLKSQIENEIKLLEARNRLEERENQVAFENGLTGLRAYFEKRRQILTSEVEKEIEGLRREREQVTQAAERERTLAGRQKGKDAGVLQAEAEKITWKEKQDLAAIDLRIAQKELELKEKGIAITEEERKAIENLGVERLSLDQRILEITGKKIEAQKAALEIEKSQLDTQLRAAGMPAEEREAKIGEYAAAREAEIEFNRVRLEIQQALFDLEMERQKVQELIARGVITEAEGEDRILGLERERLPLLEQIAQRHEQAAAKTGDPEKIGEARQTGADVRQIGVHVDETGRRLAALKKTAFDSLVNGLGNFLSQGIQGAKNFGEAIRNMAKNFVGAMLDMIAQMLAFAAIKALFKGMGFSLPAGDAGGAAFAQGGLIRGPGTGTSDSIPAWLSDREFVVRAAAVKDPGALSFLEEFNRRGVRALYDYTNASRFADGGFAGAGASAGAQGLTINVPVLVSDSGLAASLQRNIEETVVRTLREHSRP